jgi:hypothetical protein
VDAFAGEQLHDGVFCFIEISGYRGVSGTTGQYPGSHMVLEILIF